MTERKIKIECRDISKVFHVPGQKQLFHVLDRVNLAVYENEFLVLLGPGQCGKTILLNCIAGLMPPSSGEILLEGNPVCGPGPDRAMVFQRYALFPWMTVESNVAYGLSVRGAPVKERLKIAHKYIELVGLTGFEKAYPEQLSGGMKQRVGIARAYANNPDIMLLDEPFGQLDAQTRIFMQHEITRIWEQEKRTVIFVTNNIDEALFLGDRIVLMEGKLPGTIKTEFDVHLPRPREHTDMELLKLRETITDQTELVL